MKELKALNKRTAPKSVAPEKIIQFGEGNFLRAFVDWIVWNMNKKTDFNGSVVVVQPLAGGMVDWLNGQDCLYHVNLQGKENGQAINTLDRIDVISRALNPYSQNQAFMALAEQPEMRFIISNTTEAGIAFDDSCKFTDAPAASYPGKLVQLLFHRYKFFEGDPTKGMILMPCELIFLNGHHLKECIYQYIELWKGDMGADYEGFKEWFTNYCYVCATLVDRIVPGFPRDTIKEIQQKVCYKDNLVVKAESFHLWVIEKAENMTVEQMQEEFPAHKAGLHVLITDNEKPYHERKVTLLNGPHTVLSPVTYLSGVNIVRDACKDNESQGKAESGREGVNHALKQIIILLDNQDGYTQHGTVGSNQRQEDTERLIKCRRNLLQDNLYHLNQGCNHEDERQGLEILQSERIEYILLNTPGNDGCQGQDKSDGTTHTDGCINFLRYAQEWTDTEKLRQDDVVDEYRRDKYQ